MPSEHCVYEPCIVDKTTPFSRELCHTPRRFQWSHL